MIKISNTSKMPCISWSLPAIETCPGAFENGELVEVCDNCYADKGFYVMESVRAPRLHNMKDWKREDWVSDMITLLEKRKLFRWFDSGDMYTVNLANKIFEVVKNTPHCKHWLPTRMYKFKKFEKILNKINSLPNIAVRLSSDSTIGVTIHVKGFVNSTVVPKNTLALNNAWLCPSSKNKNKCGDCRACWNKEVKTVAYINH
ncbi:MAG: hypothetical protein CBD88_00925 [Flavobacteriales bacterium TMED228]|nr:MAG: hypothetical protein CBD88_00925 [Flavobacteriales bacterium TMED228]|tara:strand:- start:1383 stop:1988 length:606 start_codon:yes stop_codon:yes gene_type:complete